jgi:dethiobiotin synthetase
VTRILVAGTGTEVGKTFVTAALARTLVGRGLTVAARKPVQSFEPTDAQTDADALAAATGEHPHSVCPQHRWLARALAPPMAAEILDAPSFTIAELAAELDTPGATLTFVESAGGVRSPIASDGDTVDLAAALQPALVMLVADAGLGAINLVRLSVAPLHEHRIVVFLNRFDDNDEVHVCNADWLRTREGLEVVTDLEALATLCERLAASR